jgi:hypothetical protein
MTDIVLPWFGSEKKQITEACYEMTSTRRVGVCVWLVNEFSSPKNGGGIILANSRIDMSITRKVERRFS